MIGARRLLVAGCGDLGTRVARLALADGARVFGLRRDPSALPAAIEALAGDLARDAFDLPAKLDAVVLAVAPSRAPVSDAGPSRAERYRHTYGASAEHLIARLVREGHPVRRFVFVSSTGVYGEDAGGVVDEDTPPQPTRATASALLATEARVAEAPFASTSLRLGGIYGPGRERLVARARAIARGGQALDDDARVRATNRVHVDDAAAIVRHLLTVDAAPDVVCGVDREPALEVDVLRYVAQRLGLPWPDGIQADGNDAERNDVTNAARGKRVACRRLLESGFVHRYPTFREGYAALLARPSSDDDGRMRSRARS